MAKKKQTQPALSQAENAQVRSVLTEYHEIAAQLHTCQKSQDVEPLLVAINNLSAQESPLREGMTTRDWIRRRSEWDDRFAPDDLQPTLLATREILTEICTSC